MSFLNSITNYFDSSAEHADRASTYLSEAGSSAYEGGSSVVNGASNLFSTTTAVAAVAGFNSFEWVSGRVIGINSATHFANWGASLFGGAQATSWATQATTCAAMTLGNTQLEAWLY